jgi:lysophospholipase L1-like esterase
MRRILLIASACLILFISHAQTAQITPTKKVISVIGSSTAAGMGATPADSSWVNLTKFYYQQLGLIDTIYNRAVSASTTYDGMPTGFTPPSGRPAPELAYNITKALSYNPDIVLIAYASNDVSDGYSLQETMSNFRTLYQTVINAGKIAYVTTTQPRSSLTTAQQEMQKEERDSILMEFPGFSMNFYDPVVAADSLNINPLYSFGDGIHLNDAGHQVLFQVVKNTDILASFMPLALTIDQFTATLQQQDVLLQWTSEAVLPALFVIQRSQDGASYTDLGQENSLGSSAGTTFNWLDADPLPGKSYYRLRSSIGGDVSFSTVASILRPVPDFAIVNVYVSQGASMLVVDIQSAVNRTLSMNVVDVNGALVSRQVVSVATPASTINLSLSGLARGMYFLRVSTEDGKVVTRRFLRL